MPAYAAVATEDGHYIFCGGEPVINSAPKAKRGQSSTVALMATDFAPSFMSSKISGLRMLIVSTKECLLRNPLSKRYSFSVNDCPRKVQAKNEKRRNRKQKQLYREMVCAS